MEGNVLKTLLFFSEDENDIIYRVDTIKYTGKIWLVPGWIDNPKAGWRIPERIICLEGFQMKRPQADRRTSFSTVGYPDLSLMAKSCQSSRINTQLSSNRIYDFQRLGVRFVRHYPGLKME